MADPYNGPLLSRKNEVRTHATTQVHFGDITLSKISQTRDRRAQSIRGWRKVRRGELLLKGEECVWDDTNALEMESGIHYTYCHSTVHLRWLKQQILCVFYNQKFFKGKKLLCT